MKDKIIGFQFEPVFTKPTHASYTFILEYARPGIYRSRDIDRGAAMRAVL